MNYRLIFSLTAMLVAASCAFGFDLPVKRISGIDYYYYTAEHNESFTDIVHKFGVTREDIIRNNPSAADGIRKGMTIYFPVHEFPEDNESLPGQSSSKSGPESPTRYKVQKGETLYGIARRFDITPDEIVDYNPQANSGLKAGQILLIPHPGGQKNIAYRASDPPTVPKVIPPVNEESEGEADTSSDSVPSEKAEFERKLRPVDPPIHIISDSVIYENETPENEAPMFERKLRPVKDEPVLIGSSTENALEDGLEDMEIDDTDSIAVEPVTIALMMPFMLNEVSENKKGKMSVDFVRGFMLGVNSMKDKSYPTTINVCDTEANVEIIGELLKSPEMGRTSLIIAHEEGPAGELLPSFSKENECYILNLFSSQDSTYLVNPYFLQANIPAQMMYEKAYQALLNSYPGYIPVILASKGGRAEKMPFTNYLQEQYNEIGIEPIEIVYDGMFTSADTDVLEESKNYVFIPVSGSLSEFNKFAHTLVSLRENNENPLSIALFGYPDWTTYRGESLELLHRLNATIYSRFYCDYNDEKTREFINEFVSAYGYHPMELVPSQALLGYDSARYILSNIENNEGEFSPIETLPFKGVQSTFLFTNAIERDGNENESDESGYVNTSLYIITFLPGQQISVLTL